MESERLPRLAGDGEFGFHVVGTLHHQERLEALCGGRSDDSQHHRCAAMIIPELNNPHDPHAVMVVIDHYQVGYLPAYLAAEFRVALQEAGARAARCAAMIVGGWHRPHKDDGYFGVRLDAIVPFEIGFGGEFAGKTSAWEPPVLWPRPRPRRHFWRPEYLALLGLALLVVLPHFWAGSTDTAKRSESGAASLLAEQPLANAVAQPTTGPVPLPRPRVGTLRQAAAQEHAVDRNEAHLRLTALNEEQRRAMFSQLLSNSGVSCPQVTRTFYQGSQTSTGNAFWAVACRGAKSFLIMISADEKGSTRILECDVLKMVSGGACFVKDSY